jgi:putative ABC transport system permease protein
MGLLDNASITIEHLDADLWVTSRNTANVDFAQTYSDTLVQRVRSIPGVERADNLIVWFMTVALPTGAREGTLVYALEDFERWGLPWNVVEGKLQDLRRGRYLFLDESATKRYGEFKVGDYREVVGNRMKIIGRTRDALSFSTTPISFMDFRLAQELSPDELGGNTTYILIKGAPGADIETLRREVQRRLPYNDVFTRKEWAERSRNYWVESTGLGLNMAMTVFLGCLVGLVVVAQTLYTSTMEHIKEFGTVKAIGGSNGDIYRILAKQASISAVVGFLLGGGMARLLQPAMEKIDLKLIIVPELAAGVAVGTLALCLAAAMISFRKVASIDPALVFRA